MVEWPEPRPLFQEPGISQRYLCVFQQSLGQWLNQRAGDFEELALQLMERGGISEKLVCQVLIDRYRDALAEDAGNLPNAELYLKKAYMHFLLAQNKESEEDLRAALGQAATIDDSLTRTCLNNLVVLLDREDRHAEIQELVAQYPAYDVELRRISSKRTFVTRTGCSVYVSYAWGDESPDGTHRERVVDLLCTMLRSAGVDVQRDKDHLTSGDSIEEFARKLSKADRIVVVISAKSLYSKFCMAYELFQAFQRCAFQRNEFQERVIPLVLDDASDIVSDPQEIAKLAKYWLGQSVSLRSQIDETDPDGKSSRRLVNDMKELAERLPDMLGAINDVVMKRGFDEIVSDNFSEVFDRLPQYTDLDDDTKVESPTDSTSTLRDLADGVGRTMASQLETACLAMDTNGMADLFDQSAKWLDAGGEHATPEVRRRLLLWLANAILCDHQERRLRDQDLPDAAKFLERASHEQANPEPELDALAVALRLHIEELTGQAPVSLDELRGIDHPIALANRVRLLVNREDFDAAFDLVHHNALHERWAYLAVIVYARLGRFSDADAICEMMRTRREPASNPVLSTVRYHRCLLAYAEALYQKAFVDRETGERVSPDRLSADERKQLGDTVVVLEPLILRILGTGRILNGFERAAAELIFEVTHLLLDHERSTRIAQALISAIPISRHVADAIRLGYLKPDQDLLVRLARDWPDDLDVAISIAEIQVSSFSECEVALNEIGQLSRRDLTEEQITKIVRIAFQISATAAGETRNRAFGMLAELAGADHYCVRMAEAKWALDEEDFARAQELLSERPTPEDPDWLNIHAMALEGQGKLKECLSDLKDLSARTGDPEVLSRAVDMALRVRDLESAIPFLEKLVAFPAERRRAEHALAKCLYQANEGDGVRRAAELYERLYNESPNERELAWNAAVCLKELREVDRAVVLLQDVVNTHPGFLKAVLLHAEILQSADRADEAFEWLDNQPRRERFWSDKTFLVRYMDLGYRTNHELEAHRAMMQIRELDEGKDVSE